MGNRPKNPANARNKNVLIIGGSGSGKTRFWLKPNLLQGHSSYVITDPKGDIVIDCGHFLLKKGYDVRIFNTINFRKSMHYNPFSYIHSEKDILKLTTTLISNTKGDGKAGDEFWTKAETLLYCALIGYIHYEAPQDEQNFATLIEFLNAMEVREDDENFQNPVDQMFEALKQKKPNHFAVRQYAKFKLTAGVITSKSSFNTRDNKVRVEAVFRGFYIIEKGGRCYAERQHHSAVRTSVPGRRASGRIKQYQQPEKNAHGLCEGQRPALSGAFY